MKRSCTLTSEAFGDQRLSKNIFKFQADRSPYVLVLHFRSLGFGSPEFELSQSSLHEGEIVDEPFSAVVEQTLDRCLSTNKRAAAILDHYRSEREVARNRARALIAVTREQHEAFIERIGACPSSDDAIKVLLEDVARWRVTCALIASELSGDGAAAAFRLAHGMLTHGLRDLTEAQQPQPLSE